MNRRGVTLIELVVALALTLVASASILRVLVTQRRAYAWQMERAQINATLLAAATILPGEVRELDPADPLGADLFRITPTSVTYRPVRNLYVVCRNPVPGDDILVLFADYLGSRPLNPEVDSALIFADGNPLLGGDDQWVHADLKWARFGDACPQGARSVTVGLGGVAPAEIARIHSGAPFRTGAVVELTRYRDATGSWWVGRRRFRKSGRRPSVQPLLGPVAPGGFELRYYDMQGAPTSEISDVRAIGMVVTVPSTQTTAAGRTAAELWKRRVELHVSFRNASRS